MNQLPRRFRITHPFHPRFGEQLELLRYRRSWGHESIDGQRPDGELVTVPVGWTDAGPEDPWVVMAEGRSWYRVEDLLRLVALVEETEP